jgi:hypothetical protein
MNYKKYPIDFMFYCCLMNSDDIYNQAVGEKKRIWQCNFPLKGDNLTRFGFVETRQSFGDFQEARPFIHQILQQEEAVFISVDAFYMKSRNQLIHSGHSIMLFDYKETEQGGLYWVQDFSPDYCGYLEADAIEEMFDSPVMKYRSVSSFAFDSDKMQNNFQLVQSELDPLLDAYSDKFSLYDGFLRDIQQYDNSVIDCYDQAFTLISGSRLLFNKFLLRIHGDEELSARLQRSSDIALRIKYLLLNAKLTGAYDTPQLLELCELLRSNESIMIDRLKTRKADLLAKLDDYRLEETIPTPLLDDVHANAQASESNSVVRARLQEFLTAYSKATDRQEIEHFLLPGFQPELLSREFEFIIIEEFSIMNDVAHITLLIRDLSTKWTVPQKWQVGFDHAEKGIAIKSLDLL